MASSVIRHRSDPVTSLFNAPHRSLGKVPSGGQAFKALLCLSLTFMLLLQQVLCSFLKHCVHVCADAASAAPSAWKALS